MFFSFGLCSKSDGVLSPLSKGCLTNLSPLTHPPSHIPVCHPELCTRAQQEDARPRCALYITRKESSLSGKPPSLALSEVLEREIKMCLLQCTVWRLYPFLLADSSTAAGHKAEPWVLEAAKPHAAKYCAKERCVRRLLCLPCLPELKRYIKRI